MRIISGLAKGKKIISIEGNDTRPTLDRVREAVFGGIQFEINDANVLDLFGGTGALSLEAVSRGAKKVVCCDNNQECCNIIKTNATQLGFLEKIEILNYDYNRCLDYCLEKDYKFDFVFLDPPYKFDKKEELLSKLFCLDILNKKAKIIFEHKTGYAMPFAQRIIKQKKYGQTTVSTYQ